MLKRLKYGKEFERLFAEYYNRMYYRAYHYVNDTEISKDIVSDAFGYVWEHYEALRQIDTVAVLFQQVRSRSIDFFRHRKVVERYADLYLQLTLEEEVPLQEEDERLARIAGVLNRLPVRTRYVLEECYFHRKKYAEVAENIGISINAVKKHIMKALNLLREEFRLKTGPEEVPEKED